jgi:hypothetical protein
VPVTIQAQALYYAKFSSKTHFIGQRSSVCEYMLIRPAKMLTEIDLLYNWSIPLTSYDFRVPQPHYCVMGNFTTASYAGTLM